MSAPEGKRVSWVELYLDLIFVLAVGQLAHVIEAHPEMRSVWIALGLFVTLWWTWIGFAVLYNRYGADSPAHRLIFLAGSIPAGVAAVALEPASAAHATVFAIAMAAVRVVLAVAHAVASGARTAATERVFRAYVLSAALWGISVAVPGPWRYVLWGIAVGVESGAVLTDDKDGRRRARQERDFRAMRPTDPDEALDSHHFAERFGLFLIILLGEIVISAGDAAIEGETAPVGSWAALVAAMLMAAALWWLYFDSAAEMNLRVLDLSGGSQAMARGIFAAGHMLPAFSLIAIAAGLGLLLEGEPPALAYWLPCLGLGVYLIGTRVFFGARSRAGRVWRVVLLIVTFMLGRLHETLSPHAYVYLLAAWSLGCAVLATQARRYIPDVLSERAPG